MSDKEDKENLEDQVVVVPAEKLVGLLDSAFGVFQAVDDFYRVFDAFVGLRLPSGDWDGDEFKKESPDTHDNVVDLEERRLDKNPSDVCFD